MDHASSDPGGSLMSDQGVITLMGGESRRRLGPTEIWPVKLGSSPCLWLISVASTLSLGMSRFCTMGSK